MIRLGAVVWVRAPRRLQLPARCAQRGWAEQDEDHTRGGGGGGGGGVEGGDVGHGKLV